jgi:hypothetical protein
MAIYYIHHRTKTILHGVDLYKSRVRDLERDKVLDPLKTNKVS